MIIQKTKHHQFKATTLLNFQTKKDNEQAGLILYRTANGYYSLLKDKSGIALIKKHLGKREIIEHIPYNKQEVFLSVAVNSTEIQFSFGETQQHMTNIGSIQNVAPLSDNKFNKFNGTGVGVYATSNGKQSRNKALNDWFEYISDKN